MKKLNFLIAILCLLSGTSVFAQVDHQIQLTGTGANGKLTGIQQVSANQDAVSANYMRTRDSLKFAIATGSNNAYAVSLNPAITGSYTIGMVVLFQANFANTGAATLNVNSLGAVTILKNYNANLASGDIQNGQMVSGTYDGNYFQMLSQLGNSTTAVPHGRRMFGTPGTYSFTVPAGVSAVWVSASGGGGGGGCGYTSYSLTGGSGGGAAAVMADSLGVTPGRTYTITVGSGGSVAPVALIIALSEIQFYSGSLLQLMAEGLDKLKEVAEQLAVREVWQAALP